MTYKPSPDTAKILNWMLDKIKSVPYGVTLRWAFYQCVQELGLLKSDYSRIKSYAAHARKCFWNGWSPDTLVDDTRTIYKAGHGYINIKEWLNSLRKEEAVYDVYLYQDNIVQIWFEAQAMYSQFNHYASPYRIPLIPFKGDTSINHKWQMAEYLAELYKEYRKPIIILYFGDYEPHFDRGSRGKRLTIPINALKDVRLWFLIHLHRKGVLTWENDEELKHKMEEYRNIIKFIRVGLNQEHIDRWHLPENPERPGEYQWEALGDEQAKELIEGAIQEYWDPEVINEIINREDRDTEKWQSIFDEVVIPAIEKDNEEESDDQKK